MKATNPWRDLLQWILEGEPCALLVVASADGSGPGSPGSVMAVAREKTSGTVGGGRMEKELVDTSLDKLRRTDFTPEPVMHRHVRGVDRSSGMVCSGSQTTLVIPVTPRVAEGVRRVVDMPASGSGGSLEVTACSFSVEEGGVPSDPVFHDTGGKWMYRGPVGVTDTVYIIGGGHVGRALAALLPRLSFRPVIIDSRESRFLGDPPDCEWITSSFPCACEHVREGRHSWAVIMTPEHTADAQVLRGFQGMEMRYIGMMASSAKRDAIYSYLLEQGVPEGFLRGVHCPVGIPIGSRTPDEIAVSIAAHLIGVRSCILALL